MHICDVAGKMGNHRQALQLIVTQLQEVKYAIDFCKEHNYESLWAELITYSLEKPSEMSCLSMSLVVVIACTLHSIESCPSAIIKIV